MLVVQYIIELTYIVYGCFSLSKANFQSTLQEVILFCCMCVFMSIQVYSSSHSKIEMKTKVLQRIYLRLQLFYQQHESFSIVILLSLSQAELGPWRWLCSEQKIFSGPQNHLRLIKVINGLTATQVRISFLLHRVQLTENEVLPQQGNCCFHDTIMSQCDDDCVTVPYLWVFLIADIPLQQTHSVQFQ